MLKRINKSDLFILLWVMYRMQNLLYEQGVINQFLQIIIIAWAGVESLRVLFLRHKSPIIKSLFCLVTMYCLYGGWTILFGESLVLDTGRVLSKHVYLQTILNGLLPVFLFYNYTRKGLVTNQRMLIYTIIFLIISIILFFKANVESGIEEFTNNVGYEFLYLIPFVCFFYKKPVIQYLLLGICVLFIMLSVKRGAMLIGGVSLLIFIYNTSKVETLKGKIIYVLLSICMLIGVIYYFQVMLQTNDYFLYRMELTEEGHTSGRGDLYSALWNVFLTETSLINLLFGYGANATVNFVGNCAHMDWLETLINHGLIGLVILSSFYISLLYTAYSQRKKISLHLYTSFNILIWILVGKSIISISIQDILLPQSLLLGYYSYLYFNKNLMKLSN